VLRRAAKAPGVSLNDYCARSLVAPRMLPGAADDVAGRAAALFGERLAGVLVYGSYVRGEAEASSDVDVLVVVDRSVRLTRALYRRWDESPLRWEGRPVEPHFVHRPDPKEAPSGLWAEVAIDGIVLFERGLSLSQALAQIRHAILAGRIVRRTVHGQPYWVEGGVERRENAS